MANFNVTLSVAIGKGGYANFSATNGDGLAYNDPLDVNVGDTVTFIRASGSTNTAKFRNLTIFTRFEFPLLHLQFHQLQFLEL